MLQEQYPDMPTRVETKPSKPAICDKCGRTFARLCVMKRHREICNRQRLPAKKCRYENCTQRFHHISRLAAHMKEAHNANIKPEVYNIQHPNVTPHKVELTGITSHDTVAAGEKVLHPLKKILHAQKMVPKI
jgi:hypothetical protein